MLPTTFLGALGQVGDEIVESPRYDVDAHGRIERAGRQADLAAYPPAQLVRDLDEALVLPGLVNAHSHGFQRGIRGMTQRHTDASPSTFWSWREAMYAAANRLDPAGVYAISRQAFGEMLAAGCTCVGEFHYLHHQPGGHAYDDPNELAWQVVRAAQDVGIGLVLLVVFYERAGFGQAPLPEQLRFCDTSVDSYLGRVDALRSAGVSVGLAPHSVRAVAKTSLREIIAYANEHELPLHTHLSEQPRENHECRQEHGCSPTELFAKHGAMKRPTGFTAVHAIFTDDADHRLLAGQTVCACPTTEADLGDGIVPAAALAAAGVCLAIGSDSNAVIDPIQEVRLLEMGERLRTGRRMCLANERQDLASALLSVVTRNGARSLGQADHCGSLAPGKAFDATLIDLSTPYLLDVPRDRILDALLTGGTAAAVRHVIRNGRELA